MTYEKLLREWIAEAIGREGSLSCLCYQIGVHQQTVRSAQKNPGKTPVPAALLIYFVVKLDKDVNSLLRLASLSDVRYKVGGKITPFGLFSLQLRRSRDPNGMTRKEFNDMKQGEFHVVLFKPDNTHTIVHSGSSWSCAGMMRQLRKKTKVYRYTVVERYCKLLNKTISKRIVVVYTGRYYEVVETHDLPH